MILYCEKCRAVVDEAGRGTDGYFTCGYGGSHRPVQTRPSGAARRSGRKPPLTRQAVRQVIRQQQAEDAREMGRLPPAELARQALRDEKATYSGERARLTVGSAGPE